MIWWVDKLSENIIIIVNNKILGKVYIWWRYLVVVGKSRSFIFINIGIGNGIKGMIYEYWCVYFI